MADNTAPVVLLNDKEQQWLEGAIKDRLLRHIDFNDIKDLQMGVASGGFGMIHAGKWRGMRVAVKVLYNPADFIQEVGIHKLVQDSENIVKFYGITRMKGNGDYGMVLQFAGKGSLRDYLSRHFDSLDWTNKMRLARDVAAGISFIHEDNICHHDLHSRNVLIDQSGRALITDFGLSRYLNHANSNNGVRGVVPYISPERLRNSPFDHSSDVYSLGVIMWELTSGHPPFNHDGENFLLPFQIMRGKREEIIPGTPVEYSRLYQQCWDGEPLSRPALPLILQKLNSMLSEESGEIHVIHPKHLPGSCSLPTVPHTVPIPMEPQPNSAPIAAPVVPFNKGHSNGYSTTLGITSVAPLNLRNHHSRSHSPVIVNVDVDNGLDAVLPGRLSNVKLSEEPAPTDRWSGQTMTSPIASVRSLRTHGAVGAGAGPASAGGHAHPVSPKQPVSPLQINSVKPFQRPPYTNQDALRHSPKPVNVSAALPEMTAFEDSIPEKGAPDSPILPTKMPMPSMNSPLYPPLQQHHIGFPPPHSYLNPGPAPYKIYQPHNMDNNVIVRQVQLESAVPGMPYGTLIHPPREYLPVIPAVQPKGCNNVYDTPKNSNSNSNGNSNNWIPRDGKTKIKDFFMACRNGSIEAVKWHLNHGANVMEPYDNMSGRTPLHAAAMSDSYEVMRLLCEAAGPRLNLNELDDSSQTPLHLLTLFGRNSHESLVYMLKKGANPNAQDSERRTPLMTSFILNDNALVVETLLDYGADPNIRCQENNALAEAAIRLRFQCVKVLLETDLSMSEQSSLEHAMDVCYRVTESVNRNQVLSLLVRWKNSEGMQKRQTLARMILKGTLPFGEKRIDQQRIARQVLAFANHQ